MKTKMKRIGMVLVAVVFLSGCTGRSSGGRMTTEQVLQAAEPAMSARFPESFSRCRPYGAELSNGIWHVRGTLPPLVRGGTPEAKVQDSDGKVIEVYHTQ